jgi:DNA-binding NarL/FixJ family response regulator
MVSPFSQPNVTESVGSVTFVIRILTTKNHKGGTYDDNMALGNEPQSGKKANLTDLTTRKLEILQLVLAGKANKAMASEIYISAKTVEFHLANIYKKIGVQTCMMAGIWTFQQGLQVATG